MLGATAPLALIHELLDDNIGVFALSILSILVAAWGVRRARTGCEAIIAAHPTLLFVLMTYLYASIHGNIVPANLNEPDTAFLIAFAYQCSVLIGMVAADMAQGLFVGIERPQIASATPDILHTVRLPLVFTGALGLLIAHQFEGSGPIASIFSLLMWLGMAAHFAKRRGVLPLDALTACIIGLTAAIAVVANARSALFETLLFLAFAHLIYAERLFTFVQAVLALFAIRVISVFSDIMLSVRWLRQVSTERMIDQALNSLFSADTLIALINPFHVTEAQETWAKAIDPHNQFTSHFFVGNISTLQRFTILPQMDLILHGLQVDTIRWRAILNVFLGLLPDLGQEKDLIFSDRITWELGLRAYGNVGRPMVTAAGEFFAMGGVSAVILLTSVLFFAYFLALRLLKLTIGSEQITTLLFSQLIVATLISTTALSAYGIVFRTIPILILFIAWLKFAGFGQSGRQDMASLALRRLSHNQRQSRS